ncbi:MAG: 50S ribosomal protein L32 [Deltaproteobacteria bacterium]|jgi:large subunit ribosomal protein L32|nr:50S ribosomal protein L32 [Deltaproteobacteria bacterium]
MPNPMKKHTRSRRNNRRSHDALSRPAASTCPSCNEVKRPHHVCPNCGSYRGREIVKVEEI